MNQNTHTSRHSRFQRFIASLVVLAIAACMLPVSAFAAVSTKNTWAYGTRSVTGSIIYWYSAQYVADNELFGNQDLESRRQMYQSYAENSPDENYEYYYLDDASLIPEDAYWGREFTRYSNAGKLLWYNAEDYAGISKLSSFISNSDGIIHPYDPDTDTTDTSITYSPISVIVANTDNESDNNNNNNNNNNNSSGDSGAGLLIVAGVGAAAVGATVVYLNTHPEVLEGIKAKVDAFVTNVQTTLGLKTPAAEPAAEAAAEAEAAAPAEAAAETAAPVQAA